MFLFDYPENEWMNAYRSHVETYPSTRYIIDCTKLYCQRPLVLSTQRALYLHCNTHVTYKGFIGISPVFLQLNENKPLNELSNDEWTKAMKKLSLNICRITSTTRRVTKPDIAACICNLATFGSRISVWVWVQYQLGITVL